METIKDAQAYVKQFSAKGTMCPCCGQLVKQYKRKLNSGMAFMLIQFYKHRDEGFLHGKDYLKTHKLRNNHDWTLLRHWGLLIQMANYDSTQKHSGYWKITARGEQFVRGEIKLPRHVIIYNNTCMGFSDQITDIKSSLGDNFNYYELMDEVI